jgi:hypothetical protein
MVEVSPIKDSLANIKIDDPNHRRRTIIIDKKLDFQKRKLEAQFSLVRITQSLRSFQEFKELSFIS